MPNLLDALNEYGFTELIPIRMVDYDDGGSLYDGFSDHYDGMGDGNFEYDGVYYDNDNMPIAWSGDEDADYVNYNDILDEEDEFLDADEVNTKLDNYYDRPKSVEDLKQMFGYDYMPDEEFLQLSPAELLGLTKAQLKFVNPDVLRIGGLPNFAEAIKNPKTIEEFPDVEQRIKYCTVNTIRPLFSVASRGREFSVRDRNVIMEYLTYRIVLTHSVEESLRLLDMLADYYSYYFNAKIMNAERQRNGEPVFDYTLTPKPSRIKDLHDKASRDHRTIIARAAAEKKEMNDKLIADRIKMSDYERLLYTNGVYSIIAPKNCDDMVREGDVLNHCVADYISDFASMQTDIYFLRENKDIDQPYFTLEVKVDDVTKKLNLKQCYTYNDEVVKSSECRAFIREWAKKKHINIDCII